MNHMWRWCEEAAVRALPAEPLHLARQRLHEWLGSEIAASACGQRWPARRQRGSGGRERDSGDDDDHAEQRRRGHRLGRDETDLPGSPPANTAMTGFTYAYVITLLAGRCASA